MQALAPSTLLGLEVKPRALMGELRELASLTEDDEARAKLEEYFEKLGDAV